jgi:regulator of replication initiation timing
MLFSPNKLPKVIINQYQNLPESRGLYMVTDEASRIWYIGKASNIKERHISHDKKEQFIENKCKYIHIFCWEQEDDIDFWEQENIEHYQPPLNWNLLNKKPIVNLGYDKSKYLDRYSEIKQMIAELDSELEQLKPNIVSILEEYPDCKLKTNDISAFLTKRKIWKYSAEIENLKQRLSNQQKIEQESGIAEITGYNIYPVVKVKIK